MIELTVEQIEEVEKLVGDIPGQAPKVMARAINRAADSARTEASRKVREKYHIKHKDVVSTIRINKASPSDLSANIRSRSNVMPLTKFKVTPKQPNPRRKKRVIVRVKRGGGTALNQAFVARMSSGHVGVFERVGKSRLPITQLYGPSVPHMLDDDSVKEWVEDKAAEKLEQRLDHELSRAMGVK